MKRRMDVKAELGGRMSVPPARRLLQAARGAREPADFRREHGVAA